MQSKGYCCYKYVGDGKMGRAKKSRGDYAMGAPHMDMSCFFSQCEDTEETETDCCSINNMDAVTCL